MMTWNYRVFREDDGEYVIREVFYAEDGTIISCTANAVEPFGRTLKELAQSIDDFKAALALPVLTLKDIPEAAPTLDKQKNESTLSHEQLRRQLGLNDAQDRSATSSQEGNKRAS
jgi:hypothetical protein